MAGTHVTKMVSPRLVGWARLRSDRWTRAAPLWIGILAFLLRVIYLEGARQSSLFEALGLDAKFYDRWAREIASGDWIGSEPFFMGPLYPYTLAVLYKILGTGVHRVALVQAGIDSVTCALVYVVARRLWQREWAGLAAGGLACVFGPMMLYTGEILFPTLAMLLNVLFLYLVLRADEGCRGALVPVAGAILGFSALGKATVLVFYPVVVAWWMWGGAKPGIRRAAVWGSLLLAGTAAVVLPVTIRNRVVGDDWVWITSNAGLNFYIGNCASASGAYLKPEGLDVVEDPEGFRMAEAAEGRTLKASEVSRYWFSEAGTFVRDHPGRFLSLYVRKMVFFWSALEIPQIENFNYQKRYSPLLRLPFPTFGWIAPLAVVALLLAGERRRWAVLPAGMAVAYSLTIAVFFVTARYRMAVVPGLLVLAGGGILFLVEGLRARRRGIVGLAALAVLVPLSHWNPYGVNPQSGFAEFEYRIGLSEQRDGLLDRAAERYRAALALDPDHSRAELNLAVLLAGQGLHEEGRRMMEALIAREPGNAKAHFNLGVILGDMGELEAARESYARALSIDEHYAEAWHGYGVELYRAGDLPGARDALARAVSEAQGPQDDAWARRSRFLLAKIDLRRNRPGGREPVSGTMRRADILAMSGRMEEAYREYARAAEAEGEPEAYYETGAAALVIGRLGAAVEALETCVALDPQYPGAHFSLGAALVKREDYGPAIRAFEAEAAVSPRFPEVFLNLGLLYENYAGDPDAALEAYDQYLRLGGSQEAAVRQRVDRLRSAAPR